MCCARYVQTYNRTSPDISYLRAQRPREQELIADRAIERDEYGPPSPPPFSYPGRRKERRNFGRSSDSEFLWGRYRSGSDTDLWRAEMVGM